MTEEERKQILRDMWNSAIDAVLAEMRIAPPSRIGEAAFIRRLIQMKYPS